MRILDVSPRVTLPLSSGSRIRMYNLLSRLSQRHEIRQFSQARIADLSRPGFKEEVRITPSYLEYRYGSWVGSPLCEVMERAGFGVPLLAGFALAATRPHRLSEWAEWADLLIVEFPWQYAYCRSIAKNKLIVLATHNVQAAKVRSGGRGWLAGRLWYAGIEALERRAVLGANLALAVSGQDRDHFARLYGADPRKIVVIPNGASPDFYHPADEATRSALRSRLGLPPGRIVIFPAAHQQVPILEAMKWVRRTAARLPDVTFLITGAVAKSPTVEGNLLFSGFVNDYASYLRSADCLLCPIDRGAGTKIKLIESAAAGLPIVAFPESIHGTTFRHGEHLFVVEKNAEAAAAALRYLLEDREAAQRLGTAARAHALEHHDWGLIARKLESALLDLIESTGGRADKT